MNRLGEFLFRVRSLFRKRADEAGMAEEIRLHLEMQTEANIAAGMTPEKARYAARREFGGVAQVQEAWRDERTLVWLEQWAKDVSFVVRSLIRARGYTLTVIGTLALGIGVATVVFNLTSWILLSAQPYPAPERLFQIGTMDKQSPFTPVVSGLHFLAYQEQTNVFSEFAAVQRGMANVVIEGEPVAVDVMRASPDCLHTLGITPVLGRGFRPEEHRKGADNVVVISDLFWRQRFAAVPDVLGRTLLIDQQVCTVIGVLQVTQPFPQGLAGDVYRPLVLQPDPAQPFEQMLFLVGRLKAGVSSEQAGAALATVKVEGLPPWAVAFFADQTPVLANLNDLNRPETYWVMAVAAMMLFGISCLNAMILMLVRLLGRQRELGIRRALGATRGQIVRLLVLESIGLSLGASLIVVLAARWLFPSLFVVLTDNEAVRYNSFWDWGTLGCVAAMTVVAAIAAVFVPAVRLLKADLNPTLKESGAGTGESRRLNRMRNGLVVLQAAFAVVMLTGTGLMVRSFERLQRADLGFDHAGLVKVQIVVPKGYQLSPEARLQLFDRLQERLSQVPGVTTVSYGQDTLLEGGFFGIAQLQMSDGSFAPVAGNFVSSDFPKAAGLVLRRGRWFSEKRGVYEVVINETLARKRFGDEDPVGQSIKLLVSGDYGIPVVGVVKDVRETVRSAPGMRLYTPIWAYPPNSTTLFLRLQRNPGEGFAGAVRRAIYALEPQLIVSQVSAIEELVGNSMWAERYAFRILKGLTFIALGLVMIGVFSVVAFTVASRRQELGVRVALGATPGDLHRLVLKHGVAMAGLGLAVGVAAALGLTRFMRSLLFETTPYDPLVFVGVGVVLLAVAVAACWLPARRAARIDPAETLRAE